MQFRFESKKREDINWREFNLRTAKEIYRQDKLNGSRIKALVLDDSIKTRRGKKMEGVSCHFYHVTNRHVMGQVSIDPGICYRRDFLPVDSQVYISQVKAKALVRPFRDGRSAVAKRYHEATTQGKPEMAGNMMNRAMRVGLEAEYLVADAWFGTKPMIRTVLEIGVCPNGTDLIVSFWKI